VLKAIESDPALKVDRTRLESLVRRTVFPHFDFELMSRRVLGKYWRRAGRAQRRAFVEVFQGLLLRTYSTVLTRYAGQSIAYPPLRPVTGAALRGRPGIVVRSAIETGASSPTLVDYYLYEEQRRWLVYDVTIGGVSLIITYRASFGEIIRRDGLRRLIAQIREKNEPS